MIYIYLYVHGGGRFLLLLPSAAQSGHIAYKKGLGEPPAAPFIPRRIPGLPLRPGVAAGPFLGCVPGDPRSAEEEEEGASRL